MGIRIIAEAGVNHNGDLGLARKMVQEAAKAGADYVKFQTFIPEKLVTGKAPKAAYQDKATGGAGTQLEMLGKLALRQEDFRELKEECQRQGIGFLSTPFDLDSIDFLETMDMDFWKLPSGEITNLPFLERIARTGKPVVMSTGMCGMEEVKSAARCLKEAGAGPITLLHCNTEYPTPMRDVNLRAMLTMREELGLPTGYSDHTRGIEVSIAAAALGAVILEKHFTLDRSMEGPDHAASLEPDELAELVRAVRNVEAALGSGEKVPSESERKNIAVTRKSIVAKRAIAQGELFGEDNLTAKRPGTGISPMRWHEVIGRRAGRAYEPDEMIELP